MPTYDYECDACGHKFEEFQSFSAETLTVCPQCAAPKLRRLFGTGAAILFKGSGFYETDYRSEGYKSSQKAESDSSKPAESKPADAKPAGTPAKGGESASKGDSAKTDTSAK